MKIVCSKSALSTGINTCLRAVPVRTTKPILECIMIDASEIDIHMISNDEELGIDTIVEGEIIDKGKIALDAKFLSEIVRKLPDSEVTIETDEKYVATISCEKAVFTIPGKEGEDFVYLPYIEKDSNIVLSQFTLKEIIRQTIFSIGEDDKGSNVNRKIMTGELFEVEGNNLRVVSLDSYRIAIRNVTLNDSYDQIKVIVPGKSVNEISKILTGEANSDVYIYFTQNHILFEFDDTIVVSRLIEGEFFKINHLFNTDYNTKISINRKEFLDCIDRATLLVKEGNKKPVIIDIEESSMKLNIVSNIGKMNEEIDIMKEGNNIKIGFDPKYMIDALRVIDDENIDLYFINAKTPCSIHDENNSYVYFVFPVNY